MSEGLKSPQAEAGHAGAAGSALNRADVERATAFRERAGLAERHDSLLLDTTMAFTPFIEAPSSAGGGAPFPSAELPRLRDLGDRVLLGSDFPNIPYPYPEALESLERAGLGAAWLRAVCHDNAARLFAR